MNEAPPKPLKTADIDRVIRYHIQTKHHFNRYARSLGYLDWSSQPDPFRRFEGAPLIALPLLEPDESPRSPVYDALFRYGSVDSQPVSIRSLSRFLELSLALSAWKKSGATEWALRSNPSSGNLHPTEGYLVLPQIEGLDLQTGLYHYAPKEHGLEWRAAFPDEELARLMSPFPSGAFLFGFSSIHWREAWKYGERAFRYCNHDVGHALGAARFAAATLGWKMALLEGMEQRTVARLLGVDRSSDFASAEQEHPDCLAVIWPYDASHDAGADVIPQEIPLLLDTSIVDALAATTWQGKANRLSSEHGVHWQAIDEVATASWKNQADKRILPLAVHFDRDAATGDRYAPSSSASSAAQIIRQRRSAVSFDGRTSVTAATFFRMLRRTVPGVEYKQVARPAPWDVWPYDPALHLMIFVHRVEGLVPGLYLLVRDPAKFPLIQASLSQELTWKRPLICPEDLLFYQLWEGDVRYVAAQVSCRQSIAADSAFSLGMLAEFDSRLQAEGAWFYPRLFWEAGLLGQILYLEAEAAGVRGTGIGCFFDDAAHALVGIEGITFQSLYHFTIGGAVEDRRLLTLPAYFHLNRQ